jgi:peroxiredoxin
MKKLVFILSLFVSFSAMSQDYDTVPAYKKNPTIPAFKVIMPDSTWFTNTDLPKGKPVIITYFNPECGHCQLEAKEIADHKDKFKDAFMLFVSFQQLPDIKAFAEQFHLDTLSNFRFARDPVYFLPAFFRVEFTPYNALYGKDGKLYKTYPMGMNVKEVTDWLKQ